jgi:isopenicillin N synthase-like dioxygenase
MGSMIIPSIAVSALFSGPSAARDQIDRAIMAAATSAGFMTISGLPADLAATPAVRQQLLRLFGLPDAAKSQLLRQSFDASRPNVYRGFFPLQNGSPTYKEGIDLGPDVAYAGWQPDASDPLTELTPLPRDAELPGWHDAVRTYYRAMERLGASLMQSLARSLGLPEEAFDEAFQGGISTLRMIHYPVRPDSSLTGTDPNQVFVEHQGRRRYLIGGAHVDSGFVTLLAQDGVEGLQAKSHDGTWIDVPPVEGTIAINFGALLERWTGGRVKATEHRVLGPGRTRYSIPFFYEPRVDAVIRPIGGGPAFEPFSYGDHLWSAMTKFVEFRDIKDARTPRGVRVS